jgi:hypothetical protein
MPRGRIEATAEVWRDRVTRWKESGLTAKQFAQREGIARPGALSWWRYHLAQEGKKVPTEAPLKLVRLEPVKTRRARRQSTEVRSSYIEIVCGAHRVIVSNDFDEALLRRVLSAMERAQ